jgi:hypothetical protein
MNASSNIKKKNLALRLLDKISLLNSTLMHRTILFQLKLLHKTMHDLRSEKASIPPPAYVDNKSKTTLYCSFCGKNQQEVQKLIAGPTVYVCDECTARMVGILCEEGKNKNDNAFVKKFLTSTELNWQELLARDGFINIVREIEFPPEYYAAGMTILSSFSKIIREKYSTENIRVSIQQDGTNIALIIETPDGIKEKVEQTLYECNLVVQGQMSPEELMGDKINALDLKQQLRIAKAQLENQTELLNCVNLNYDRLDKHTENLESQVKSLTDLVAKAFDKLASDSKPELELLKLIIPAIVESHNMALNQALDSLKEKIENGITKKDEAEIRKSLEIIKKQHPSLFARFVDFIQEKSVEVAGTFAGSVVFSTLSAIINSIPK